MFLRPLIITLLIITLAIPATSIAQDPPRTNPPVRESGDPDASAANKEYEAKQEIDNYLSAWGDKVNEVTQLKFSDLPKSVQDHFRSMASTPETRQVLERIIRDMGRIPADVEKENYEEFRRNIVLQEGMKGSLAEIQKSRAGKISNFASGNGGFMIGMVLQHCGEALLLGHWDRMTGFACYNMLTDKGGLGGLFAFSLSSQFAGSIAGRIPMLKNSKTIGPHAISGIGLAVGSFVNTGFSKAYGSQGSTYLLEDLYGSAAERTKAIGNWFTNATGMDRESFVQYRENRDRHAELLKKKSELEAAVKKNPKDDESRHALLAVVNLLDYSGSRIDQYQENLSKHFTQIFNDTIKTDRRGVEDMIIHTFQLVGVVVGISIVGAMFQRYLGSDKFLKTPTQRKALLMAAMQQWRKLPPHFAPFSAKLENGVMQYYNFAGKRINKVIFNMFMHSGYVSILHAIRFLMVDQLVTKVRVVSEENLRALISGSEKNLETGLRDFLYSNLSQHKSTFDGAMTFAKDFEELYQHRITNLILGPYQERYAAWMHVFDEQNTFHTKRINYFQWLTNSYTANIVEGRFPNTSNLQASEYSKWVNFLDQAFVFNNGEKFGGIGWHTPILYEGRLDKEIKTYLQEWNREIMNHTINERLKRGLDPAKARGMSDVITPSEKPAFDAFVAQQDELIKKLQEERAKAAAAQPASAPGQQQQTQPSRIQVQLSKEQIDVLKRRAFNAKSFAEDMTKRQTEFLRWAQDTHDAVINAAGTESETALGYIIDGAFFHNSTPTWLKVLEYPSKTLEGPIVGAVNRVRNLFGYNSEPEERGHNRFFSAYWAQENGKQVIKFERNRYARIRYNLRDVYSYQFKVLREVFLNLNLPDSYLTTELRHALWNQRELDYAAHRQRREIKIDTDEVLKAIVNIANKTRDREKPFIDDQPTTQLNGQQKSDAIAYTLARLMTKVMVEFRSLLARRHAMLGYSPSGQPDIEFAGPLHSKGKVIDPFGVEDAEDTPEHKLNAFLGIDPSKDLKALWELEKDMALETDTGSAAQRNLRLLGGSPTTPPQPQQPPPRPPTPPTPPRPPNGRGG